jgi:8-oxo-dGTP pyrophosphatase MutT (NUDIX family)
VTELFLASHSKLAPSHAVAAILVREDGRYLLQHRDPKPDIWYPDHWGLFGGAVEAGEDKMSALKRELREEISWAPEQLIYFTNFDFDFNFAGAGVCYRSFFVGEIPECVVPRLVLQEGAGMESFTIEEIFALPRLIPYDAFALWLHFSRERIVAHSVR